MSHAHRTRFDVGKRWLWALLLAFVLGGLLIGMGWWITRRDSQRLQAQIRQKLAALHAAGKPVTEQDLARRYPDPPLAEDAAQLLAVAFSQLTGPTSSRIPFLGGQQLPPGSQPLDAATREDLRRFVDSNRAAVDALPDRLPANARFPSGRGNGFNRRQAIPLVKIRKMQQTLAAVAVHHAEHDEAEAASRSLDWSWRLSRTLPSETLVSYMVRRACEDLTAHAVERTLNRTRPTDVALAALDRSLAIAATNGMAAVLEAERCVVIWAFESARDPSSARALLPPGELTPLAVVRRALGFSPPLYSDQGYLRCLELLEESLAALELPPGRRFSQVQALMQEATSQRHCLIGSYVIPNLGKAVQSDARIATRLLLARTAVAIERWRRAHDDQLPQTLTELVPALLPAVPADPFDGQPLRYRPRDRGFRIFSVAEDGVDNGGQEQTTGAPDGQPYDLTFGVDR